MPIFRQQDQEGQLDEMTVEKTSGYQQIGTLVAASLRYKVGKPTSDTINVLSILANVIREL